MFGFFAAMVSSFSVLTQIPDRLKVTRFQKILGPHDVFVSRSMPLKVELGALSPWQKRNFLPLPQEHG